MTEVKFMNPDAEAGIIGYLMTENRMLERIPFLAPEHFGHPFHAHIFGQMQRMIPSGKEANAMTLKEHLPPGMDAQEGMNYLIAMYNSALGVTMAERHARHVVELAQRRALHRACMEAAAVLESDPNEPPAETALQLAEQFDRVSRGFGLPVMEDDFTVAEQILRDLEGGAEAFDSGMCKLNEAMGGGFYPGKAYGFAARKKVGKTILASTLSCNLNLQGIKHLFVCGEMSPKEIHQRTLARLTDTFPSAFRSGFGQTTAFAQKLVRAMHESKRCTIYYNAPALTFDELRRVVVTSAVTGDIKGFILDYWQLVGGKGKKGEREHLDEVSQWIASVCRKHDLFAIVMAQINQEGNTRGGEGMRLAFDQVYQLHRDDITMPYAWLEMMDTRYTAWNNIGSKDVPGLYMEERGPWFRQL